MKKKNKQLNVFTYGMRPWKLRFWFHNIKCFFINIGYAWSRATKGYCSYDLWDLSDFYSWLFVHSLEDFRKSAVSAPYEYYDNENDSIEPWRDYLREMRLHFYNSIEENEVLKNEISIYDVVGLGYEELSEAYWNREKEISNWRESELKKGLEMMEKVWPSLWW